MCSLGNVRNDAASSLHPSKSARYTPGNRPSLRDITSSGSDPDVPSGPHYARLNRKAFRSDPWYAGKRRENSAKIGNHHCCLNGSAVLKTRDMEKETIAFITVFRYGDHESSLFTL